MIGLFQENGPCHFVNGDSTPSLNENSWNNYANMIYIDQPIGVGFSYGTDDVTSTVTAAPYVWKLLQAFYAQFPEYESRDFAIFTEVGFVIFFDPTIEKMKKKSLIDFSPTVATTARNLLRTFSSKTPPSRPDP